MTITIHNFKRLPTIVKHYAPIQNDHLVILSYMINHNVRMGYDIEDGVPLRFSHGAMEDAGLLKHLYDTTYSLTPKAIGMMYMYAEERKLLNNESNS